MCQWVEQARERLRDFCYESLPIFFLVMWVVVIGVVGSAFIVKILDLFFPACEHKRNWQFLLGSAEITRWLSSQQDPNSSIHFSYFSRSAAETDLETFFRADSKSSMVVGMCISSRERLRISSGVRPSILRLIAIREASLKHQAAITVIKMLRF
ncbi:hypothetical protein XENOCAPTIV_023210 [Xenoophorus captivus]|uniref:Uncharacterized protein n=1 Tax=Xenoophorus captivus TaxID=1517983 RepID=A0ABV0SD65_9TELE